MEKSALITGISGQDGAYLAQFLLGKGYRVWGMLARRSSDSLWRLRELGVADQVGIVEGDLTDISSIDRALATSAAGEVYNLGAQSFVATSWQQPLLTAQVTGDIVAPRLVIHQDAVVKGSVDLSPALALKQQKQAKKEADAAAIAAAVSAGDSLPPRIEPAVTAASPVAVAAPAYAS